MATSTQSQQRPVASARPQIIAHRGASGSTPENTLAAFRRAWQLRADGIELDVRVSADGEIMVHHDADTSRCGDGSDSVLQIATSTAAALRRVDVGRWRGETFSGETIPLLREVLDEAPAGQQVLIEIKSGPETAAPLAELFARHGSTWASAKLRPALISFRLDSLLACQQALPELPCYPVFSSHDNDAVHDAGAWFELAAQHRFRGLDPDYRDIDARFAERAQRAGLELLCWTVNEPSEARRLAGLGVAALTTDWPDRIADALSE